MAGIIHNYTTDFDRDLLNSQLPSDFISGNDKLIRNWLAANTFSDITELSKDLHFALMTYFLNTKINRDELSNKYRHMVGLEGYIEHAKARGQPLTFDKISFRRLVESLRWGDGF